MGNTVKTVKVVVAGEVSGARNALDSLASKSQSVASQVQGHFRNLFGALNASGQLSGMLGQFSSVLSMLDQIDLKSKGIGNKLAGAGVGLAGAGGALILGAQKDVQAQAQLKQAFENTGNSFDDYKDKVEQADKSMAKYGYTADETDQGLRRLVTATRDPKEALKDLSIAANLAAEKHEDLGSAVNQMAMIIAGKGTKVLQQLGIQNTVVSVTASTVAAATRAEAKAHDALATAQQKVNDILKQYPDAVKAGSKAHAKWVAAVAAADKANQTYKDSVQKASDVTSQFQHPLTQAAGNIAAVAQATKGQAAAAADTLTGKMKAMRTEVENHISAFGQKYGPVITATGTAMTVLGTTMRATQGIMEGFRASSAAAAAAEAAKTAAEAADTAAEAGEAAGEVAVEAAGAPLILIIGAIVLAIAAVVAIIYELVKHWKEVFDTIKHIVADVVDWIKHHWELLVAIFTGPIGLIVMLIVHFRDQIIGFFSDIVNAVSSIPGKIAGFFEAIPGQIIGFFTGLGDKFVSVGESIVMGLVHGIENMGSAIWNAIKSHIPGSGIIGGALSAIGLAEGGIVTKPTLAMVGEAGYPEAVIPLKNGATVKGLNDAVGDLAGMPSGGSTSHKGGNYFEVNQTINLPTGTPSEFGKATTWELSRLIS